MGWSWVLSSRTIEEARRPEHNEARKAEEGAASTRVKGTAERGQQRFPL